MRRSIILLGILALFVPVLFLGCSGDDGSMGATGATGPPGPPGPGVAARPEGCVICHNGNTARNGDTHQAAYDDLYQDNVLTVTGLAYAFNVGDNTDVVTFNMAKAGVPFDCRLANTGLDSLNIYFVPYTGTAFQFTPTRGRLSIEGTLTYDGAGLCTSTAASALGDLSLLDGLIVVFGRDESLTADQESPELRFTRVAQTRFPFAALIETGAGVSYASNANVAGCEKCHTVPFLKHGYIYAQTGADPATDFYSCKVCHLDDGEGGHFEWQLVVDDPPLWAAFDAGDGTPLTPAQEAQYAYRTTVMNDVHMSHAMEFPYPQSMSNCVVCHEGKLGNILTDAFFVAETCKSCHAVTGAPAGTEPALFYEKKAPSLTTIWTNAGVAGFHTIGMTCNNAGCHVAGGATTFSEMHTGYDRTIYADAAGTKYNTTFTVTIDNASFADNVLTFGFSAAESPDIAGLAVADIRPTVLVGLYGFDTKDYYIGPHERDFDDNGDGSVDRNDNRNLEVVFGATHPRMTVTSAGAGSWTATANLAAWNTLITNGTVKRLEIGIMPRLENPALPAGDNVVALNAVSRTFDLGANAFDDAFFTPIANVAGCNNCHDALADTFHTPDRGGSIVICRMCHITKDGGSHLEMQSRSLDSYAHAVHSFQPFDINDIDFTDPVQALHYEDHVRFAFPTLGRTNCVACHDAGMFNVPDQAKSLPGVLSASEFPVVFANGQQRNIGQVPSYVAGPAARACGGCHKVNWINEDDAVGLAAFYSHTAGPNGYLVDNVDDSTVLTIIDAIMVMF